LSFNVTVAQSVVKEVLEFVIESVVTDQIVPHSVAQTIIADPVAAESVVADSVIESSEPVVVDAAVAEPVLTDLVISESVVAGPVAAESVVADSVSESSEPVVVDAAVAQSVVTVTAGNDIAHPVIEPVTISSFYGRKPKCRYDVRTSLANRSRPSTKTAATRPTRQSRMPSRYNC